MMTNKTFKLMMLVALSLVLNASNITTVFAQAEPSTNAPKLTFKESSFDFGEIHQGDVVSHNFKFENEGTSPLVLTNIGTTCGCTAPEWPREPIMPGESAEVVITFNSTGKSGIQNKIITVFSNASNGQEKIKITTNVLPKKEDGQ